MTGFPIANVLGRRPIAASPAAVIATLRDRFRVRHRDRGRMVETPVLLMDIERLDPSVTRFAN